MPGHVSRVRHVRPYLPALMVFAVGMIGVELGWLWHTRNDKTRDAQHFAQEVNRSFEVLRAKVDKYHLLLQSLSEASAGPPDAANEGWCRLVGQIDLNDDYPGMVEVGFAEARPVAGPGLTAELPPGSGDTAFRQWNVANLQMARCSATDDYSWRLMQDSNIVRLAEEALVTGESVCTGPRALLMIQRDPLARGVTILTPVYDRSTVGTPATARGRRPRGVVFGTISANLLLDDLFGATPRGVDLEVFSGTEPSVTNWVNPHGDAQPNVLRAGFAPYQQTRFPWKVFGQKWQFYFYTTPFFERQGSARAATQYWVSGILIALLVAALQASQIRSRLTETEAAQDLRDAIAALRVAKEERERLGRDLHDGAIQTLFGIRLGLGRHQMDLKTSWPELAQKIQQSLKQIDEVINELRRFLASGAPSPGADARLDVLLKTHCDQLQRASQREVHFECYGAFNGHLSPRQTIQLANVAREALSNSLRHSGASRIQLQLRVTPDQIEIRVEDNGSGFNLQTIARGQGLSNMQARAEEVGAALQIQSVPGQGTRVAVRIPLGEEARKDARELIHV